MAAVTFDPTDKKFQLNNEAKPDKESSWPYPKEEDGWVHAHNSLRDEMRQLVTAIEATAGRDGDLQEWEIACIKKAWKSHEVHIHSHHSNEDDIMVPYLKTRFRYPDKVRIYRNSFCTISCLLPNHSQKKISCTEISSM